MIAAELLRALAGLDLDEPLHILSGDKIVSDVLFLWGENEGKKLFFFASQQECQQRMKVGDSSEAQPIASDSSGAA